MTDYGQVCIKAYLSNYQQEIRRFSVPQKVSNNFKYLYEKICKVFHLKPEEVTTISWKDSDDDHIVISSDEELLEAFKDSVPKRGKSLLRLYITLAGTATSNDKDKQTKESEKLECCRCGKTSIEKCNMLTICIDCEKTGFHSHHTKKKIGLHKGKQQLPEELNFLFGKDPPVPLANNQIKVEEDIAEAIEFIKLPSPNNETEIEDKEDFSESENDEEVESEEYRYLYDKMHTKPSFIPESFSHYVLPMLEGREISFENERKSRARLINEITSYLDDHNYISSSDSLLNKKHYLCLAEQLLERYKNFTWIAENGKGHPLQGLLFRLSNKRRQNKFYKNRKSIITGLTSRH